MPDDAAATPAGTASRKDGQPPLYLVDGSGYIFRAYHALPPMNRADGTPTNAVYGFCAMLFRLLEDHPGAPLAVIFDYSGRSFRNDLYPEYKAHRPPAPEDLVPQFGLIRDAVRAFNLPCLEQEGYEADDLIATYARLANERGQEVVVVSSDKDLMQLVRPGVAMFDPMKNVAIGPAEVLARFGVPPEKVVDVQALAGDATDNVPGVPGIGVKTAAQLIAEYGDLDTLLARAGEIKQPKRREALLENAEKARVSRELVRLKDDVALVEPLEAVETRPAPDPDTLLAFLQAQDFTRLTTRVAQAIGTPGLTEGVHAPAAAPPEGCNYALVQDAAALAAWIAEARALGRVGFDTETTSLDAMAAELCGVSLASGPGRACYIPVGHVAAGTAARTASQGAFDLGGGAAPAAERPRQLAIADVLAPVKALIEDPAVLKVGHNIKYDLVVLAAACRRHLPGAPPLAPAAIDDTMLMSYVLDAGRARHNLDEVCSATLAHTTIKYDSVTGTGKDRVSFAEVPLDRACDYAAEDADVTLRLSHALRRRLVAERVTTVYETIERPLVPVIAEMEQAGIRVDAARLRELSTDFARRMAALEEKAQALAGEPFNIGSPKQLGEVLFEHMSLQGGRKGKAGAWTTDAEVLEELAAQGHDLPQVVLDWRQLQKLKSTYADALVGQINSETGRVHTAYGMAIAQTGRLSSTDPNLQNIPVRTEEGRKIRQAFIAADGHRLVSLDYSQIELRVLAHVAGIDALVDAFRQGIDIHALTASMVFGVPVEGMDPLLRRRAKAINFGIIYGISAFGLARNLGIERGEAKAWIDAYFVRYPGIRAYMDRTVKQAREQGFVETIFGRRIHLAGIADKNPARRGFAERQAINAPIQGAAADIIKRAMIRVPAALARAGLGARMLLQVHDELLFEVPEAEVEATVAAVKEVMENATMPALEMKVPLVAEAGVGRTWDEAH